MAAIEVVGVGSSYGDTVALCEIDLSVDEGEVFGLLGPASAGKTTLIRTLLGFRSPTVGTATVLGADVRDRTALRQARADIGYLPEDPIYEELVTGREFLAYEAALRGGERLEDLLRRFDVPADDPIYTYTRGERTLLGIVQAFMHDPALVFLDEPMIGSEPLVQDTIEEFLRLEAERGVTVVIASDRLSPIRRTCNRVAILRDGRLETVETESSFHDLGGKRVRVKTSDPLEPGDLNMLGVVDLVVTDRGAQFTFLGEYAMLADHLADFDLVDVSIDEVPLTEALEHYYGPPKGPTTDLAGEKRGPTRGLALVTRPIERRILAAMVALGTRLEGSDGRLASLLRAVIPEPPNTENDSESAEDASDDVDDASDDEDDDEPPGPPADERPAEPVRDAVAEPPGTPVSAVETERSRAADDRDQHDSETEATAETDADARTVDASTADEGIDDGRTASADAAPADVRERETVVRPEGHDESRESIRDEGTDDSRDGDATSPSDGPADPRSENTAGDETEASGRSGGWGLFPEADTDEGQQRDATDESQQRDATDEGPQRDATDDENADE